MTIYGIRSCNKIRNTLAWMERRGVEHTFVDVKKAPPSTTRLAELAAQLGGVDALVNRRGTTWRRLGLSGQELSDEALLDLLHENPSMIVRPLIVAAGLVHAGYDEQAFERLSE